MISVEKRKEFALADIEYAKKLLVRQHVIEYTILCEGKNQLESL